MGTAILLAGARTLALVDAAAAGQRRLTLSEAEKLAATVLSFQTKNLPTYTLVPPPIEPKRAAMFQVVWANGATDGIQLRTILVDIDTAEVWNPLRCEPLSVPAWNWLNAAFDVG